MSQMEAQRLADLFFGVSFAELRAKMKLREKMRTAEEAADQKQEKADEESRARKDHAQVGSCG